MLANSELDYISYNESLLFCCEIGSIKSAEILLMNGGDPSYQSPFYYYNSPLHASVMNDDFEMCALLLDFGSSPFLENEQGFLPIDLASQQEIFRLLSGSMNARNEYSTEIN